MSTLGAVPPVVPTSTTHREASALGTWLTPVELAVLGAIWGASFLFQRMSAADFGALPLVQVRLTLGALVLLPFLWVARDRFPLRAWPMLALIGLVNSAVPFVLFAWAAQRAPAGVVAITNSLAVLFTALVAFAFLGERIGGKRVAALFGGFAGVVVLASAKTAGADIGGAVLAGTAAAALYGVGANLVRTRLAGLPPAAVAAATLGVSALVMAPFSLAAWPDHALRPSSWGAAIALGVVCTGFAYALFYRLIKRVGAGRAVTVTYLVPLFAVAWAWVILGESLTWPMVIAGTLILGSVAVSQRAK
jgi:drug/metabolite transporter (DMT)-like permease